MRALAAATLTAALVVPLPTARAAAAHQVTAVCTTTWVDVLWDHTGVAEIHGVAIADGTTPAVSTEIVCDVTWTYSSPSPTLRQAVPGPVAAVAGASARSGTPTVCVRASASWSDGYSLVTDTACAAGGSASVTAAG